MRHSWRSRPLMIVILYFAMLSIGFINGMRSICTPLIKEELGIGYDSQATMMAVSNIASMVSAILGGISLERLGIKRSLVIYAVLLGTGFMGMWWAPVFWVYAIFFSLSVATAIFFDTCKNDLALRCFTRNFAVHTSMVAFCIGLGGVIGPRVTSWLITAMGFTTRGVFLLSALLPLLLLCMVLAARFNLPLPGEANTALPKAKAGPAQPQKLKRGAGLGVTLRALAMPVTWLCGVGFALGNTVGKGMEEWALLYFSDVYGIDPLTTGTTFMSLFFLFMSIARFANGFVMERVGYFRYYLILLGAGIVLMGAGLLAGGSGIWLLALCGGIVMSLWPIHETIMLRSVGKDAASIVAASYAINCGLRALSQWVIGLLNTYAGPAWGFRFLLVYLIALLFVVLRMRKTMGLPQVKAGKGDE